MDKISMTVSEFYHSPQHSTERASESRILNAASLQALPKQLCASKRNTRVLLGVSGRQRSGYIHKRKVLCSRQSFERQPKTVEYMKRTKRPVLVKRKPQSTGLPYKTGQINFYDDNSNKNDATCSQSCTFDKNDNAKESTKENDNTATARCRLGWQYRSKTANRFFKVYFGSRRQCIYRVPRSDHAAVTKMPTRKQKTDLHDRSGVVASAFDSITTSSVPDDTVTTSVDAFRSTCKRPVVSLVRLREDEMVKNGHVKFDNCTTANGDENLNFSDNFIPVDHDGGFVGLSDGLGDGSRETVLTCAKDLDVDTCLFHGINPCDDDKIDIAEGVCADEDEVPCMNSSDNVRLSLKSTPVVEETCSPRLNKGSCSLMSFIIRNKRKAEETREKVAKKDKTEQMLLDFGQKLHETVHCNICGMAYVRYEPADELTHSQYHQSMFSTLKFTGWHEKSIVHNFEDGNCVVVVNCDDKRAFRRIVELKKLVDRELGFIVEDCLRPHSKVYLCVSGTQVIGYCLVHPITNGYRLLPVTESRADQGSKQVRSCCCSEEATQARCGVSRLWVVASERRKNVASRLLDVVRGHFLMGYPIPKKEMAFSDPTPDGIKFATAYMETTSFLVYKTAA